MNIATIKRRDSERVSAILDGSVYDLKKCMKEAGCQGYEKFDTVKEFLALSEDLLDKAKSSVESINASADHDKFSMDLKDVKLSAPVPDPGKLFCIAGNYAEHILEGEGEYPGKGKMVPRFFIKPGTAVTGHENKVLVPPSSRWTDWEVELAVVIGRRGKAISVQEAADYIAGYTILNDISARELSFRKEIPKREGDDFFDWLVGKWPDTFAPMGPWITTFGELEDPNDLEMKLWVNDELHQKGNSGQMIFSPEEVISFITKFVTIEPGDVISTGTPAGVGYSKDIRIQEGDILKCRIDQIGTLKNKVEFK